MVYYYDLIEHTNTSDSEEQVYKLTSTEEEKKKVLEVGILSETNQGYLRFYIEREKIAELPTGSATIQNALTYQVDEEIPIGQTFKITLQNKVAGTNAGVIGYVKYIIT